MRVATAIFAQEQDTFTPLKTTLANFERDGLYYGPEVLARQGNAQNILAGIVMAAQEQGVELAPIMRVGAPPYGNVTREAYAFVREKMLSGLKALLPVDGICLELHGAMVADGEDDPEGDILAAMREIVGPDVPIAAGFDLHCKITKRLLEAADIVSIYQTHPHIDAVRTGYVAANVLFRTLRGEVKPAMAARRISMIAPAERHTTSEFPMKVVMGRVQEIEKEPGILAASLSAVQPWMDLPELGWTAVVVADGDQALAQRKADEIADLAWSMRKEFVIKKTPVPEALKQAMGMDGLVVLVDSNDSTNSGGTGDTTAILRALVETGFPHMALLPMTDPESVAKAIAAGVRNEVDLEIGGKMHPFSGGPVRARAKVRAIAEGIFTIRAPQGRGTVADIGRLVAVSVGNTYIALSEFPAPGHDPQLYRCLGLEPAEARIVVAKSPVAFKASYENITQQYIYVDTPGLTTSDLAKLPFERAPRPLFPLDDI